MTRDRREYQRTYYQENREAVRKRQNEKRQLNPRVLTEEQRQASIEACRANYKKNREERIEGQRKYYQINKERIIARNHQYALEHPEQTRKLAKDWAEKNPEATAKHARTRGHVRRARKRETSFEKLDPLEIFERDGWVCQLCESPIDQNLKWPDPFSKSLDHIIPLSKGGTHTKENCQVAHLRCNQKKGTRVPTKEAK